MAASGCIFHSNWINSDLSWCPTIFSPSIETNWDQFVPSGNFVWFQTLAVTVTVINPTFCPLCWLFRDHRRAVHIMVISRWRIKNNNFSSSRCKWGWGGLSSPDFDHTLITSDFCMFQLWMGSRSSFAFDHSVTSDHIWSDIWSLWCMFQLWMRSRGPSPWPLSDS